MTPQTERSSGLPGPSGASTFQLTLLGFMPQQGGNLPGGRLPRLCLGRVVVRARVAGGKPTLERNASTGDVSRRAFDLTRNDQHSACCALAHELCVCPRRRELARVELISRARVGTIGRSTNRWRQRIRERTLASSISTSRVKPVTS